MENSTMMMDIDSTTFPPSTSEYNYKILSTYERFFLILYEVLCTTLTILLNGYLLYTIVIKLKISKNCVYIPILTAAVLGIFHGFGINLIMTVSLIHGNWVGSMEWCGAAANIHKYIVYTIIYCQVVVSLEAAYLISHPHGYSRTSRTAKFGIMIATFLAVLTNFPITVAQFFFLQRENLERQLNMRKMFFPEAYYFFDKYVTVCYRFLIPQTLDYQIIVYFIHTCNIIAVILVMFSYAVIIRTVLKMRANKATSSQSLTSTMSQNERRLKRQGKQNRRIAMMTALTTTCVLLPWFFSLVVSLLLDTVDINELKESLGEENIQHLYRTNQFLYYVITWLFPIMTMMANSSISRATKDIITTALPTINIGNSVAHSVARFNMKHFSFQASSNNQLHV